MSLTTEIVNLLKEKQPRDLQEIKEALAHEEVLELRTHLHKMTKSKDLKMVTIGETLKIHYALPAWKPVE